MRLSLLLLGAAAEILSSSCGSNRPVLRPVPPAAAVSHPVIAVSSETAVAFASAPVVNVIPKEPPATISSSANFVLIVSEAVGNPDEDLGSYTKVFLDGQEFARTPVGPMSEEKRWGAKLDVGNHLFRFEKWDLPMVGDWGLMDAQWQPPERFIRVEPGQRTVVRLKFFDTGRGHSLQIARDPMGAPLP
jgi:hypothetical protein